MNGATPSYDANGNLTRAGGWSYTWNADNTLASMTNGSAPESYTYDADGERVVRTAANVTTVFFEGVWEQTGGGRGRRDAGDQNSTADAEDGNALLGIEQAAIGNGHTALANDDVAIGNHYVGFGNHRVGLMTHAAGMKDCNVGIKDCNVVIMTRIAGIKDCNVAIMTRVAGSEPRLNGKWRQSAPKQEALHPAPQKLRRRLRQPQRRVNRLVRRRGHAQCAA